MSGKKIQVFAYNLESLLRRAMPNLGETERDVLLKQQFIEEINPALKKEVLQQPRLSYGEIVSAAQQLDLAIQVSLNSTESQINRATVNSYQQPERESMVITQMIANIEELTEKVNQLSDTVARVNAVPAKDLPQLRSRSCFRCGNQGHIARIDTRPQPHANRETATGRPAIRPGGWHG